MGEAFGPQNTSLKGRFSEVQGKWMIERLEEELEWQRGKLGEK